MSPAKLFPGLLSFECNDADIFFGREQETRALISHIEQDPIVIVNGLSGCGKSSLVKAGVIPHLRASGRLVVYTSVFENIVEDMLYELRRIAGAGQELDDYVHLLQQLYASGPATGLTQFERSRWDQYSLAPVRELIQDAFTAGDLRRLCQDHIDLRSARAYFGPDFSFLDMIDALVQYCVNRAMLPELLAAIEEERPRQFARHRAQLQACGLPIEVTQTSVSPEGPSSPASAQPKQPTVLIIDQFEQALRPSHSGEALEAFVKGVPRLLGQAVRCATIVIILRADWLYFLESSVREFYPRLNVYSCIFTVDPLTGKAAEQAIIGPLQTAGIEHDPQVVEEIVGSLLQSPIGPLIGSYVQPLQLQMVLRTLLDLAEDGQSPELALTQEIYQQSGGVEKILRNYLTNSLGNRPEAWRLMARFVAQDGHTGRTIRQSELLAVPAARDIEQELGYLINQGFVEAYDAQDRGETFYRLAHEYLVDATVDYLNKNPDQQGWKLAEDWLSSGTCEWRESMRLDNGDGLLLEERRYLHIYQYRDKLRLTDESQRLLILTALRHGHEGICYWLSRGPYWQDDVQVIATKLLAGPPAQQVRARNALAGWVRLSQELPDPKEEAAREQLGATLAQAMDAPNSASEKESAAQALWTMQAFDTTAQRIRTGSIVLRKWSADHTLQITSYALTILLVLVAVAGGIYIHNRLEGSWYPIQTLKAGAVPLLAVDTNEPERIYAFTMGGPGPREGSSLFVRDQDGWQLQSRDLSKAWPTSMILVPDGKGAATLYVSLYGEGIVRSRDGGRTWEPVNWGLSSYALTALASDSEQPGTLFVATNNGMGVLKSPSGQEAWEFYDRAGEVYGALISTLAFTGANGGALLAGTSDGRLLLHSRDGAQWELAFGRSEGEITALEVASADEKIVYAGTSRGIMLRSRDGGQGWQVLGKPGSRFGISSIAIDPDDPEELYASARGEGGYSVWKSGNGGLDWSRVPCRGLARDWVGALTFAGGEPLTLFASTASGLFSSTDQGETWQREMLEAPLASVHELEVSARTAAPVYAAVAGAVFVNPGTVLRDPGSSQHTWTPGVGLEAEAVRTLVVDPERPQTAYAGVLVLGEWSVFVTHDGGQHWERTVAPPVDDVIPDTQALAIGITDQGDRVIYAGTVGCGVFRSDDEGCSWQAFGRQRCEQGSAKGMPADVSHLAVDFRNPRLVYAASGQDLFVSTNGGELWQQTTTKIASPIMGLATDSTTKGTAYAITGSDGLWRTLDGGATWQSLGKGTFSGAELTAIAVVPGASGHVIVAASNGEIWKSVNSGKNWRSIRGNLAMGTISNIATSADMDGKVLASSLTDGLALFVPGCLLGSDIGSEDEDR